jgi:hypothetical protein
MDYKALIVENIQYQLRHTNYERTVEVRKFSHMVSTGRDQDEFVLRYRRFEDDDLKQQRLRLYNPLTKVALARPRKYWKKMGRVENIRRTFTVTKGQDEKKLAELQEDFKNFLPGQPLEDWIIQTAEKLGVTDPNAWICFERNDQRDSNGNIIKTKVYPFIFPSVDSVNFQYNLDGKLDWFLGRTSQIEYVFDGTMRRQKVLENYYLYAPGVAIRAREIGEKTVQEPGEERVLIEVYPTENKPQATKRAFYISAFENGTTEVPVFSVGAYLDETTAGPVSYVAWFDPAEHLLLDLIRYKQFSDVVGATHAYPKRWEFEKPCDFVGDLGECEGGYLSGIRDQEHICPSCKGSGVPAGFTTEQASIKLILPKDSTEQLLELSKLSFVEPINVQFLEHLDKKLESTRAEIMAAVIDSGMFQKPTDTKTRTATEIRAIMDAISDVLAPFGNVVSRIFEGAYRIASQYREFTLGVNHAFPEDLDINTQEDEVEIFKLIKESGVGYEAAAGQRSRVIQKMYDATPEIRANIEAKYKHQPFADKSPEEVAMILSGRSHTDNAKVLWENFEDIFKVVFEQNPKFSKMTFDKQSEAVKAVVELFKKEIVPLETHDFGPQAFNEPAPSNDPQNDPTKDPNADPGTAN